MPNYLAAPLKAITREMVVELSRRLVKYGPLRELTYVGLGELDFVDLKLMYDRLGVERMYSIEARHPRTRLEYNRPYDRITILTGTTNDVLKDVPELDDQPCIIWLDYTSRLRTTEHLDLAYLASKLVPGSALFVTVNCHVSERDDSPMQVIERDFGDYFDSNIRRVKYLGHGMGNIQLSVAESVLTRHLSNRQSPPTVQRVLDVRYKDSARMQVMGWIFGPPGTNVTLDCHLGELDFSCAATPGEAVKLAWPDLTVREWSDLNRQMPVEDATEIVPPHAYVKPTTMEEFVNVHRYWRGHASVG